MRQAFEVSMSVRRYGDGPRQIAYLHGLGEAGGIFEPLLDVLGDHQYTHTVVDLPGYGRSPWPDSPLRLDALATHLASWLRGFPAPPVLVGHSMGGVLATLVAQQAPETVKAFVNIEGNISLEDCTFSGPIAAQDEAEYVARGHTEVAQRIFAMGANSEPERFYYAAFRFADPRSTHRHAMDLVEISTAEAMASSIANLGVPSVFIAGRPDGLSKRSLELLAVANVRTVVVEPAGHWVYVDHPHACARVIADFY